MRKPSSPLVGITVIDLGGGLACAYATAMLADLGARVIKVEPPEGDSYRRHPPEIDGLATLFTAANRNKLLVGLDWRAPAGEAVLERLLAQADVVVEDAGHYAARTLPFGAQRCHEINRRLVHCSITGFYPNEPARPGQNLLVQAEAGILAFHEDPDRGTFALDAVAGYPNVEHVTGLWVSQAALAALLGPRDNASVSVSMLDTALWLLGENVSSYLASGEPSQEPLWGVYATRSSPLALVFDSDEMFTRFTEIVGPPVEGDARFATQHERRAHREHLHRAVQQALARRGAERWYRDLDAAGVAVAVVRQLPEAVQRFALWSNAGLRCLQDQGPAVVAPPAVLSNDRWPMPSAPGPVGRDTTALLESSGFAPHEMEELRRAGVLAGPPGEGTHPAGERSAYSPVDR